MKKVFLALLFVSFLSCGGGDDDPVSDPVQQTLPELSTKPIIHIETNSASTGGIISSNGNSPITQKGVCWSKNPNPTITGNVSNNFTVDGAGNSSYVSDLNGLEPNTTYYVRSYAINNVGTAYGNEMNFSTNSLPANTYVGYVELKTQAEVNTFGANNYAHIDGVLVIGNTLGAGSGVTDINDLTPLNSLVSVRGLRILRNGPLENLEGLNNLTTIEGILFINYNNNLLNVDGLSNLDKVWVVTITDNYKLANLDGFQGLEVIDIQLNINENYSLQNIDGFNNLLSVGTNLSTGITGDISISQNENLENIDGFSNLALIGQNLSIKYNPLLNNVTGLNNLSSLGQSLYISNNDLITSLSGLNSIDSFNGTVVEIKNNYSLTDFCDLQASNFNDYTGQYNISGNAYNPTQQDIIDGNCSQ